MTYKDVSRDIEELKRYVENGFGHLTDKLEEMSEIVESHDKQLRGNGKRGIITILEVQDEKLSQTTQEVKKVDSKVSRIEWYFWGAVIVIVLERLLTGG